MEDSQLQDDLIGTYVSDSLYERREIAMDDSLVKFTPDRVHIKIIAVGATSEPYLVEPDGDAFLYRVEKGDTIQGQSLGIELHGDSLLEMNCDFMTGRFHPVPSDTVDRWLKEWDENTETINEETIRPKE